MPKYGSVNISVLADEINSGYWAWNSSVDSSEDSHRRYWPSYGGDPANVTVNISELRADQQALVRQALQVWQDVAHINFTYTTGTADITYNDFTKADGTAEAVTNTTTFYDALTNHLLLTGATVDVSRNWAEGPGGGFDSYFFQTLVHETGHALGLGHSGNYNGGTTNQYYNTDSTVYANDTWQWSIMSYNDQAQYGGATRDFVITPEIADIYAIQNTYGAATTRTDNTVYGFHSNAGSFYDFGSYQRDKPPPAFTIYDSGGNDTLDCSGYNVTQTIDLRGGNWSSIGGGVENVCIYATRSAPDTSVVIENAVGGSGKDTIFGNDAANLLDGRAGADNLNGGNGDDYLVVDPNGGDVLDGGAGYDTMVLVVPTLASWQTGQLDSYIASDSWANWEAIQGSSGADTIRTNSWGFPVELRGGAGNDILATGNTNDILKGEDGNDRLDGGAGADKLDGGAGNDYLIVDPNGGDVLDGGAGYDTMVFVVPTMASWQTGEVDNVISTDSWLNWEAIQGSSGADTIRTNSWGFPVELRGGAGNDILATGNSNDILNGESGNDQLSGGAGNDTYYVDSAGDVVKEAAGGGNDRVLTSVSYTLGAGQEIELFTTTSDAGTAAINLTGNAFAQTIQGNAGANVINGGAGNDTLIGLGGNDTYYVDSAGDVVKEAAGGGNDRVLTSVSYTLGAGQEIELFTTTSDAGTAAINLTGNAFAQTIQGNAGANVINGGAGNDTLIGLGGNDTFLFNTALSASINVDRITDFSVPNDTINLENSVFTTLTTTGTLATAAFFIGAAAHDADDRVVYNSATGALIYDSNGNAAGGAVQFATLATGLALTHADFIVV